MSKDGCVKVDIDCVEEIPGQAKMILSMKNYCEEYATQEQMEEIKELLKRQKEGGAGCQGGDEEGDEKGGMNYRLSVNLQLCQLAELVLISINPTTHPPTHHPHEPYVTK